MNAPQSSHQFAEATTSQIPDLSSNECKLEMRQQPENARVAVGKEKDRKPVDPPPIIQLKIPQAVDPHQNFLQSPYFFLSCSLVNDLVAPLPVGTLGTALAGTLVSSLHRLKDTNNSDGAFFVFGDLSVKVEGVFRLQFNLYQMQGAECIHITSIVSDRFPVHSAKNFTGMAESTFLTRTFSDQGVRLRLRKEPRTLLRKRGPADDNYQPRTYNKNSSRNQSNGADRQPVTSPDSQDSNSQSQNDPQDTLTAHTNPFEHRPLARQYSEQSAAGYSGAISYEDSAKRPRTGSDQSQASSFGPQAVENSHYSGRTYSDPQSSYNAYSSQMSQTPNYNYAGFSSPTQSRDPFNRDHQYMMPKLNTQMGNISPFDSQRSPGAGYFGTQPQSYPPSIPPGNYSTQMLATPGTQRVQHAASAISDAGINRTPLLSPVGTQGMHAMAPPMGLRMTTQLGSMPVRRESYPREPYPSFPDLNQNMSAGNPAMYPARPAPHNPSEAPLDSFR
ncbi:hypothetical protein EG329_003622 [Mollisiaceae sp. DMI_Dod_QoI]|nr:hypothetical protein EG329_003622 [Helotiales sp. DMI_Dod_QoI]